MQGRCMSGVVLGLIVGWIGTGGGSVTCAAEPSAREQPRANQPALPTTTAATPSAAAPVTMSQPADTTPATVTASTPPTTEQVRQAITKYLEETTQDEGGFYVDDEVTGETRELTLSNVREPVGKSADYYYVCADMKDTKTGDLLDVDFDIDAYDGELEVADVRIHQVNGKARFTYDQAGTRVPISQ